MKTDRAAHLLLLALGLSVLTSHGSAQTVQLPRVPIRSPQTFQQLLKNTLQLTVALTLDRQEYFPNEEVELTVAVTNTGSAPLEVFEPLYPSNGHVNVYIHDNTKPGTDPRSWRRVYIDGRREGSHVQRITRLLKVGAHGVLPEE